MAQGTQNPIQETAIQKLIDQLSNQLEYLRKNNSRLQTLSNRLEVDPPLNHASGAEQQKQTVAYGEGQLLYISDLIEKVRQENGICDYQLSRLESFI